MTRDEVVGRLERLDACDEALTWLRRQSEDASAESLWGACKDQRWLHWLVARLGLDTPAYYEVLAAAWRAHAEATDQAGRARAEAIAQAGRAYYEAAAAERAYADACAAAWRAYADAVRAAVPWADVAEKLEAR